MRTYPVTRYFCAYGTSVYRLDNKCLHRPFMNTSTSEVLNPPLAVRDTVISIAPNPWRIDKATIDA